MEGRKNERWCWEYWRSWYERYLKWLAIKDTSSRSRAATLQLPVRNTAAAFLRSVVDSSVETWPVWACCVPHVVEFLSIFPVDVQLKRRYETRLILFRPKKSERRPVAKESQRQKRLTSPALALNQNQNSVPGHARRGGCPVLGEGMWPGACCRAAETSDWKVKGIVSDLFASICTWRCFCFFVHICLRRYSIFRIGCAFFCVCVCFFPILFCCGTILPQRSIDFHLIFSVP